MRLNRPISWALLFVALLVASGCSSNQQVSDPASQLQFGVNMAQQGLWSEALFRFQQAERLDPRNPRVFNNLAVASEAVGDFERAQEYYQKALKAEPGNAELKRNYVRFVEFYQSFKPKDEEAEKTPKASEGDSKADSTPEQSAPGDG